MTARAVVSMCASATVSVDAVDWVSASAHSIVHENMNVKTFDLHNLCVEACQKCMGGH